MYFTQLLQRSCVPTGADIPCAEGKSTAGMGVHAGSRLVRTALTPPSSASPALLTVDCYSSDSLKFASRDHQLALLRVGCTCDLFGPCQSRGVWSQARWAQDIDINNDCTPVFATLDAAPRGCDLLPRGALCMRGMHRCRKEARCNCTHLLLIPGLGCSLLPTCAPPEDVPIHLRQPVLRFYSTLYAAAARFL